MELKINKASLSVTETILEELQEQSVEMDYVLPDYEPDIFRMIGCEIQPAILRETTSADRISYELRADVRVLYCGSHPSRLQCISQQMTFSRSVELPRTGENVQIKLRPRTSYANCRAVSPRRLEVHGAIAVQISVTGEKEQEVIQDVFGMHVQLKKTTVTHAVNRRSAVKQLVLSEEIPLGETKPPVCAVIRSDVRMVHQESSVLAGKLIVKGEARVQLLYTWQKEEDSTGVEQLQFSLPFSQIVDMAQIDDSYQGNVEIQVVRCDCKASSGKNGIPDMLQCELELRLACTAVKTGSTQIVTDAFSTLYPCHLEQVSLEIDMPPVPVQGHVPCTVTLHPGDTTPSYIHDLHCQVRNVNLQLLSERHQIRLSGMLCCSLLTQDSEGSPMLLEKEEAFEGYLDTDCTGETVQLQAQLTPIDSTYHLSSDGTISIQATLLLQGFLYPSQRCNCLSALQVDGDTKLVRDGDYALKLYYGVEKEDIWEIAKRCHTSVQAILEENDLTEPKITTPGMLFIPIVH